MKFTRHKTRHFKEQHLGAFGACAGWCNHHPSLVPERSTTPKGDPGPSSGHSLLQTELCPPHSCVEAPTPKATITGNGPFWGELRLTEVARVGPRCDGTGVCKDRRTPALAPCMRRRGAVCRRGERRPRWGPGLLTPGSRTSSLQDGARSASTVQAPKLTENPHSSSPAPGGPPPFSAPACSTRLT